MTVNEIQIRTRNFALGVLRVCESLPRTRSADVLGRQVIRAATSVGANYRAACRARSRADFIAKLKLVEEEADETLYWLELLRDSKILSESQVSDLAREANELLAITVSSIKTARQRNS